jgi:uncharacterized protein YegP (UPF0339 family)
VDPETAGWFEIYRDAAGAVRWRLRSAEGTLLAASRGYETPTECATDLDRVRALAATAPVLDDSGE